MKELTPEITVAGQILPHEIEALAQRGFKTIICNRPDNEDEGQPDFAQIEEKAAQLGITAHHQPVTSGQITQSDVDDFARIFASAEKPVLAYCRSGARCTGLFQHSQS